LLQSAPVSAAPRLPRSLSRARASRPAREVSPLRRGPPRRSAPDRRSPLSGMPAVLRRSIPLRRSGRTLRSPPVLEPSATARRTSSRDSLSLISRELTPRSIGYTRSPRPKKCRQPRSRCWSTFRRQDIAAVVHRTFRTSCGHHPPRLRRPRGRRPPLLKSEEAVRNDVAPRVSKMPGFIAGYWTAADSSGLSMVVFESEEAANAADEMVRVGSIALVSVTVVKVEVRAVEASA
jgi:hypothetical protein